MANKVVIMSEDNMIQYTKLAKGILGKTETKVGEFEERVTDVETSITVIDGNLTTMQEEIDDKVSSTDIETEPIDFSDF